MGLKKTCIMVVMALTVIILMYSFHLCLLIYYHTESGYVNCFGFKLHSVLLADLSFTLAILFQITLIILIIIGGFSQN